MGWMNDTLVYMSRDPIYRRYHHNSLTFSMIYAFTENFVLPFSHDEVVHGKGSMLSKMPGDLWQKFANLRTLYAYMYAHPGKKLLFMGCEIGQWTEWNCNESAHWHLLQYESHWKLKDFVGQLNRLYRDTPALHQIDFSWEGFEWVDLHDADGSTLSFMRKGKSADEIVICVFNFTPVVRAKYRVGVPRPGEYEQILNSDATEFGGGNVGRITTVQTEPKSWNARDQSFEFSLPPLAAVFFRFRGPPKEEKKPREEAARAPARAGGATGPSEKSSAPPPPARPAGGRPAV
jgi:1,4-alpha-glucan branching enzyme